MKLNDLGQHHRTMLKRLIRSNPNEKFVEIIERMLESSDRMSQLRNVRGMIEGWKSQYLDVIENTTEVKK